MADNLSVNITADATKLRAQLALAQADVRAYAAETRKAAEVVREAGNQATTEQIVALEKSAAAHNAARGAVGNLTNQIQAAKPAMEALTKETHNHGAATEAMVLIHEAMSGRFSKMGGSLMILTQRIAGSSLAMMGLAGAFGVAAMGAMHLVEWLDKVRNAKLLAEAGGVGGAISPADLDAQVDKLRKVKDVTAEMAGAAVHAFAAMHGASKDVLTELTSDVRALALRLGEEVPQAAGRMVEAWNLNERAGADLLEKTRASAETVKAFTKAAQDNDAIKARTILLQELSRSTKDTEVQTRLAADAELRSTQLKTRLGMVANISGKQTPAAGQGMIDAAKIEDDVTRAQRLARAIASVNDEMKLPPPVAWSQLMSEQLHVVTREAGTAARTQGKDWRQTHEAEAEATVRFWQRVVSETKEGTKNRIEAEDKLVQAEEARDMVTQRLGERSAKEALQSRLMGLAAEVAANHDNLALVQQLETEKLAMIRAAEGEGSKLYKEELRTQTNVVRSAVAEQIRLFEEDGRQRTQAARAMAVQLQSEHQKSHAEILQDLVNETAQIGAEELIRLDGLIASLQKGTLAEREATRAREKLAHELADRQIQEQARATEETIRAAEEQTRAYKQAFDGIASAGRSTVTGLITGTETWRRAEQRVAGAVVEGVSSMAMHIIAKWIATEMTKNEVSATATAVRMAQERGGSGFDQLITGRIAQWLGMETTKTGATAAEVVARETEEKSAAIADTVTSKAAALSSIEANAAVAASGAYAAIALIPYIGPALAPAAAATAFIGASSFASALALPSFDVGAWSLPSDMVAQVHQGEMIIPADIAAGIRGGAAPFPSGGGGAGDVHLHVHANDANSVAALFRSNGAELARIVAAQMKNNPSLRLAY